MKNRYYKIKTIYQNIRVLYNIDLKVRQGTPILLYCHYTGEATKDEVVKHQNDLNAK